jgi:acyl-CoA synthetase (AMP-forming)/AMP-acid ligase II
VPDARMGKVGKAFVIAAPGTAISGDDIIAWARDRMANFKVPRFVEFVEAYPLNASGKVLKTELRARQHLQSSLQNPLPHQAPP